MYIWGEKDDFFFCLETKETKIQDCKIAAAQATRHRLPPFLARGFITEFNAKEK